MAEEKPQRWYNSRFFTNVGEGIGIGAIILSLAFGIRGCSSPAQNDIEIEKARHGYVLKESDLNNNGMVETFYEVDGKKYFSTIDGKNLEDSLK